MVKRILMASESGDFRGSAEVLAELKQSTEDQQALRIGRYHHAVVLAGAGKNVEAAQECFSLAMEYMDELGLEPEHVLMTNPPEIAAHFGDNLVEAIPDLKRLADSLALLARAKTALGESAGLARIHASKFYIVALAYRSAISTSQDVVDELLDLGDLDGARQFMEQTLIPSVEDLRLLEHIVPVRGQHAVLLAYSGEIERARTVIGELEEFTQSSGEEARREISQQRQLIEDIAAGRVNRPLGESFGKKELQIPTGIPKVGRNAPCPCGSGQKFKKCHGKPGR